MRPGWADTAGVALRGDGSMTERGESEPDVAITGVRRVCGGGEWDRLGEGARATR